MDISTKIKKECIPMKKIKVGVISNMFEIAGSLMSADKTIVHG